MSLAKRILNKSRLSGSFTLRSGVISDTYFDKYQFESEPGLLLDIAKAMAPLVPNDVEVLAGLEMGGIPVVTMLSQVTGLECAFVRKVPKEHGTCRYSEGVGLLSRKILLVEDVVSSGGQIIDTTRMLREDGVEVTRALCVIDRETGGRENLAEANIELISLFRQSDLEA